MHFLVTGGAGYLGSHMVAFLLDGDHSVTVIDNYSNSNETALHGLKNEFPEKLVVHKGDVTVMSDIEHAIQASPHFGLIDGVFHFAGLKSVNESVSDPLSYYSVNVTGTQNMLSAMLSHRIESIVFSSSATVYGVPERLPVDEDCRLSPSNPYGWSKMFSERIIMDAVNANPEVLSAAVLRYFNPVGANPSRQLGERPVGIPNNIMPYLCQVALGQRDYVSIFGGDYETRDGTGVRDFIHVMDLIEGHWAAFSARKRGKTIVANLGTGKGYSVLELLEKLEQISNRKIPYKITTRRPGDLASVFSNTSHAENVLGWRTKRGLQEMVSDHWNFVSSS